MKKSTFTNIRFIFLVIFLLCLGSTAFSQYTLRRAKNVNAWYYSDTDFTWTGGISNGYCHGYGTIYFFDAYGNSYGRYSGGVSYGKNHGFGTMYNSSGTIYYSGYWANDNFEDKDQIDRAVRELAQKTLNSYFAGGNNLEYSLVKAVFGSDRQLQEIRIRMTFNGNVKRSNFYDCTLVVNKVNGKSYFVNVNRTAEMYINTMTDIGDFLDFLKICKLLNDIFSE